MTRRTLTLTLAALSLVVGSVAALAQSASISVPLPPPTSPAGAPPPALSAVEQWIKEAKNPTPWLTWGTDLRVRDEYYNNAVSLTSADPLHEQNVVRFRGRIWTTITPITNVTINARLAGEAREWTRPSFAAQFRGEQGMEWRYGVLDNLNLKWNNVLNAPLTISAGRQDVTIGDFWNWWLVADGTPGDGSWTYFLDGIRATYDAKDIKTKFDLMYIYQNALADDWVPTIGRTSRAGTDYPLTEQQEQGVIAYVSNKSIQKTTLDGYFMYKRDNQVTFQRGGNPWTPGDNADIYTLGGRVTGMPAEHWQYSLEGGYQFGWKQDPSVRYAPGLGALERDISAFGGNARLSYLFRDSLNSQAHLVFEYLSGDDPSTPGQDEMFDILWGRWPRYSELYIYSYAQETSGKIAQHNNLMRVGGGYTLVPMKNMTLGAYYNALFAPEEVPTRTVNAALFSQNGNFRGHYMQAVLQHTFSKHLKGHLWAELLWQGDYYSQRDLMSFLRAEISLSF